MLKEAAADLKLGLGVLSEGFSSTAEQDRLALLELRECKERQFRNESGGRLVVVGGREVECSDNLEEHQREWEMVLLFRLGKKAILRGARQRLEERCIDPPTSQHRNWSNEQPEQGELEAYDEDAKPEAYVQEG